MMNTLVVQAVLACFVNENPEVVSLDTCTISGTTSICDDKCCSGSPNYCCDDELSNGAIVGIVFGSMVGLMILCICFVFCIKMMKMNANKRTIVQPTVIQTGYSIPPYRSGAPQQFVNNQQPVTYPQAGQPSYQPLSLPSGYPPAQPHQGYPPIQPQSGYPLVQPQPGYLPAQPQPVPQAPPPDLPLSYREVTGPMLPQYGFQPNVQPGTSYPQGPNVPPNTGYTNFDSEKHNLGVGSEMGNISSRTNLSPSAPGDM